MVVFIRAGARAVTLDNEAGPGAPYPSIAAGPPVADSLREPSAMPVSYHRVEDNTRKCHFIPQVAYMWISKTW